jgi:hypothetical protein
MTSTTCDEQKKAIVIYDAPADSHAVADILTGVIGLSETDALIHARSAPGVLKDRLAAAQSELLIQRLTALGLSAEAIDPAELIDFHAPDIVHQARLEEQGLVFATDHGGGLLPWEKIQVISVGQVPLETTSRLNPNDDQMFVAARRMRHKTHLAVLPPTMELWLVDGQKPIRLDQTRMNYDVLGEAKTESSTENFRRFLTRLTESATRAHITPATRAYLEHGSALKYMFRSTDELQRVTQLQTLLARRK